MRSNLRRGFRLDKEDDSDPRESPGAQVIDLTTRNVLPSVTQRTGRDGLGLAAGVAVVALLGAVTLWSMNTVRGSRAEPRSQSVPISPPAPAIAPPPPRVISPAPLSAPTAQPVLAAPPQSNLGVAPSANPNASPTVVFDIGSQPVAVAPTGAVPSPVAGGNGNGNDDFAARLGITGGGKATAEANFDPKTTVTQGTLIPAVLETAIDTDVPGYVRAIVSDDVRSFDGSNVLVPRSSRLIGQYKSGLSAGQKRAYVIWTRLIRPDGVSVNIASPAIAFGGETGLAGKVNSHFFERFGSAMLLSVIGGLSAVGGNAGVLVAGGGQSAAAAAVSQGGQIGPTIRVRQGQPIRVFTSKDLDFSKVS